MGINATTLPQNYARLLVDGRGLCWNATEFAMKKYPDVADLKEREATVLWAFFYRLQHFYEKYHTNKFVFAWDSPNNLRKRLYPQYKANRRLTTPQEIKDSDPAWLKEKKTKSNAHCAEVAKLIPLWERIEHEIIPEMGFKNSFSIDGYEGDDIIAQICKQEKKHPLVILSEDNDLYQLICGNVVQSSIRVRRLNKDGIPIADSELDTEKFYKFWGIYPDKWADVKALSGCASDNVAGIKGVGKKTAIRYIQNNGVLLTSKGAKSLTQCRIEAAKESGEVYVYDRLVRLPFEGMPEIKLQVDELNFQKFVDYCIEFKIDQFFIGELWSDLMQG